MAPAGLGPMHVEHRHGRRGYRFDQECTPELAQEIQIQRGISQGDAGQQTLETPAQNAAERHDVGSRAHTQTVRMDRIRSLARERGLQHRDRAATTIDPASATTPHAHPRILFPLGLGHEAPLAGTPVNAPALHTHPTPPAEPACDPLQYTHILRCGHTRRNSGFLEYTTQCARPVTPHPTRRADWACEVCGARDGGPLRSTAFAQTRAQAFEERVWERVASDQRAREEREEQEGRARLLWADWEAWRQAQRLEREREGQDGQEGRERLTWAEFEGRRRAQREWEE
ncbi:hypothetical protein MMC26_003680 [Xylographa opegraphella]|nr:hypothetical protein [Xylographa opegraphella]